MPKTELKEVPKADTTEASSNGTTDYNSAVKETVSEITSSHKHESPKVERPALIPLSDLEHDEILKAAREIQEEQSRLNAAIINSMNGSLERSVELTANVQLANLKVKTANLQADVLLWKHRAMHGCIAGVYTDDLKALSVPPVKE
jgi:hypothetical protein